VQKLASPEKIVCGRFVSSLVVVFRLILMILNHLASETTLGRALSGLSALSIDWENMDDFDSDVDHSAHVNNDLSALPVKQPKLPEDDFLFLSTYLIPVHRAPLLS